MPFDYYYMVLVVPALLLAMLAQMLVKSTFRKYNQVMNRKQYTGAMVARQILDANGLQHIRVEQVSGELSDHYDPRAQVIRLSDSTCCSTSVGAAGVAAHEAGHALQYQADYLPIRIRSAIIPVTRFGSSMAIPLAVLGLVCGWDILVQVGILLFCTVVAFQLITLPVEFNASRRALKILRENHILEADELFGAKKVLTAAALTYLAALVVALANLLRLLAMRNRSRR